MRVKELRDKIDFMLKENTIEENDIVICCGLTPTKETYGDLEIGVPPVIIDEDVKKAIGIICFARKKS